MEYRFNFYPWQLATKKLTLAFNLGLDFDSKRLSLETEQLLSEFGSYRQHDVYHSGGWSAICLHALDGRVDADWGGVGVYKKLRPF